ncbi:MAG: hypothetical protein PHQ98_00005, partial [Candidatus ainarchaeum sp.]|nr:hypothetical protein [Candidatus ainarchaeum sp.]
MHNQFNEERNEKDFFSDLQKLANHIKSKDLDDFVVVHHYDADGLTSGSICIKSLLRLGKKVNHICLKQLYKENINEIKYLGKNFLFVDFGSGQLDHLIENFSPDSFFILDHHEPVLINGIIPKLNFHINPL